MRSSRAFSDVPHLRGRLHQHHGSTSSFGRFACLGTRRRRSAIGPFLESIPCWVMGLFQNLMVLFLLDKPYIGFDPPLEVFLGILKASPQLLYGTIALSPETRVIRVRNWKGKSPALRSALCFRVNKPLRHGRYGSHTLYFPVVCRGRTKW